MFNIRVVRYSRWRVDIIICFFKGCVYFLMQDAKGSDVDLSIYKSKVLLVVNVASKWYTCCFSSPTSGWRINN